MTDEMQVVVVLVGLVLVCMALSLAVGDWRGHERCARAGCNRRIDGVSNFAPLGDRICSECVQRETLHRLRTPGGWT